MCGSTSNLRCVRYFEHVIGLSQRLILDCPIPQVLVALSYEVERHTLSSFLEKTSSDAAQYEKLEICSQLATTKRAALEKEMVAKRALVRHIAHEVRTRPSLLLISM